MASSFAPAAVRPLPESFWTSLGYFSALRVLVAGLFLVAYLMYGDSFNLGSHRGSMFLATDIVYGIFALGFLVLGHRVRPHFDLLLTTEIMVDIVAMALMTYASGGLRSGMGYMLMVVLAAAGLVGQGRMILFYAAAASVAILFVQGYQFLELHADVGDFFQAGITSIGFFAIAISGRLLARRIVANEELARLRGVALAEQFEISEQVMRDMQDGVLVVNRDGDLRQFNQQALALLDVPMRDVKYGDVNAVSVELGALVARWWRGEIPDQEVFRSPGNGRLLKARFFTAGQGEKALIYIEDLAQAQAQAQQIKLAALGRLTANLAHEIRNPLAAISQAAELLPEEGRHEMQLRLARIISDNAQRLNRLVAEVLELGRRDRAYPELIHLSTFLAAFIEELSPYDPKAGGRIALEVKDDLTIRFDRGHLHRVLWNLLTNALRHGSSAPGGIRILVRALPSTLPVELRIIDDGSGIEPEARPQVFEPFYTTHGAGTGLGLYIARELCEANGASLEVAENAPGGHFRIVARGELCQQSQTGSPGQETQAAS